jgi:hypothetical protein
MSKFKANEHVLTNVQHHKQTVEEILSLAKSGKLNQWSSAKVVSYNKLRGYKGYYRIEFPDGYTRIASARNLRKLVKK